MEIFIETLGNIVYVTHFMLWIVLILCAFMIKPQYLWMVVLLLLFIRWSWFNFGACFFSEIENTLTVSKTHQERNQWAMEIIRSVNLPLELWDKIFYIFIVCLSCIIALRWFRAGCPISI